MDVLEKMMLRLYEDMMARGEISEANFKPHAGKDAERSRPRSRRGWRTQGRSCPMKRGVESDAKQWVDADPGVCRDITELDAATLNRLIKEIVVHEHIDSEKTRHISIEIHFNLKPIPEVEQVTA